MRSSRLNCRVLDTDRKGLPGSIPKMEEVMADRPYGEFYDLYSISPEYFGYHHVLLNLATHRQVRENTELQ
jgi:hypothetical protein